MVLAAVGPAAGVCAVGRRLGRAIALWLGGAIIWLAPASGAAAPAPDAVSPVLHHLRGTRLGAIDYVKLTDVAAAMGLRVSVAPLGLAAFLKDGARPVARFVDRAKEADVEGLRVFLGDPVLVRGGQFYVSRVDLEHALVAWLRPDLAGPPPRHPRIIVLDPGHGGGDMGTAHNGLVEKLITLDISRRVRTLLVAQGWTVKMTRDSDIDPYNPALLPAMQTDGLPNASDRAYLQTRCNVANDVDARVFVSIHVNYSPSTSPSGTTFYYTKPQDVALAQALERAVIPAAGTADDGVVHANYYVTKHTTMPAVLIETAFISNPGDAAKLADPAWLSAIARGIASGIDAYARLRSQPPRADQ